MTVEQQIIAYLQGTAEATSYDIFEATGASSSQVDAKLKVLTEDGILVRDRKSTNGGRPVYHYKLANPNVTTVSMNGTKTTDEEVGIEPAAVAEAEPVGPKTVYLVRKDDQPSYTWGTRQHKYARVLAPFSGYTRTFMQFGGTVPSIFVSSNTLDEIAARLQEEFPELTFGLATTADEAVALINAYTPGGFNEGYFRQWVENHFSRFSHMLPNWVNAPVMASVTSHLAQEQAPVQRSIYSIMQDLAHGATLSDEESRLAVKALAQDWIDNN